VIEAVLWDVDGTLAETERDGHRIAFNRAFEATGVPWRWDEQRYGELLRVAGGRERMLFDMLSQPQAPSSAAEREALAARLHPIKNRLYADIVAQRELPLRPGVAELFDDCAAASVRMAVVTTTSRGNVDALLGAHLGSHWQSRFAAIVCAEDAPRKKPDPEAYEVALQRLGLQARRDHVIAIEDSPAGVAAARAAGVSVVVTRSYYFATERPDAALAYGTELASGRDWVPRNAPGRVSLGVLNEWLRAS
jgi:HAD superfamily hydrolase (TIGR01509 family)